MIRGHVRRDRIVLTPARAGEREGQGGANPEQSAVLVVNKTESATNANPEYGNRWVGSNSFRKNPPWSCINLNREYHEL